MQHLNAETVASFLQAIRDLAHAHPRVLATQERFWGGPDQPAGILKKTADTQHFTLTHASDDKYEWVAFTLDAFSFCVFVSSNCSAPSHDNPVTRYEVADKTIRLEMTNGHLLIKTSFTFL